MANRKGRLALSMLMRDPRVRIAPLAAQAVWVRLMTALDELDKVPCPARARLARRAEITLMAGIPRAELDAHLPTLLQFGLLREQEDGGLAGPVPRHRLRTFWQEAR